MTTTDVSKFAGSGTNDASSGTVAWTNPSNAGTTSSTSCTLNAGDSSQWLMTTNYGFLIPGFARIAGIQVACDVAGSLLSTVREIRLALVRSGVVQVPERDFGLLTWLISFGGKTAGSSSDLWNEGLSADEVNLSDFGVAIQVTNIGILQAVAEIKNLSITLRYETNVARSPLRGVF